MIGRGQIGYGAVLSALAAAMLVALLRPRRLATIVAAALLLGLGTDRAAPARRTATVALLAGVAAFVVDVYLY